jgi:hypothetical protein
MRAKAHSFALNFPRFRRRKLLLPAYTLRNLLDVLANLGKSTKEVASVLGLSVKTAETHRANLMRKMGLHSVSELVIYAIHNHIVQVNFPSSQGAA